MKKIILFVCAIICLSVSFHSPVFAEDATYVIIATNNSNVYDSASTSGTVLYEAHHKQKFEFVEKISGSPEFYKVNYNESYAYILVNNCILSSQTSPVNYLDFNAEIKTNNAQVYMLNGHNYEIVENIVLPKNQKVQIINGYDIQEEYTLISFIDDNTNYNYYVKTETLKVYGVNKKLIIAISILVASISLVLIVLGFIMKKPKKSPKK